MDSTKRVTFSEPKFGHGLPRARPGAFRGNTKQLKEPNDG